MPKRTAKRPPVAASATGRCPSCRALTTPDGHGKRHCPTCGWKGGV
jgi:hypothetical protein